MACVDEVVSTNELRILATGGVATGAEGTGEEVADLPDTPHAAITRTETRNRGNLRRSAKTMPRLVEQSHSSLSGSRSSRRRYDLGFAV